MIWVMVCLNSYMTFSSIEYFDQYKANHIESIVNNLCDPPMLFDKEQLDSFKQEHPELNRQDNISQDDVDKDVSEDIPQVDREKEEQEEEVLEEDYTEVKEKCRYDIVPVRPGLWRQINTCVKVGG